MLHMVLILGFASMISVGALTSLSAANAPAVKVNHSSLQEVEDDQAAFECSLEKGFARLDISAPVVSCTSNAGTDARANRILEREYGIPSMQVTFANSTRVLRDAGTEGIGRIAAMCAAQHGFNSFGDYLAAQVEFRDWGYIPNNSLLCFGIQLHRFMAAYEGALADEGQPYIANCGDIPNNYTLWVAGFNTRQAHTDACVARMTTIDARINHVANETTR